MAAEIQQITYNEFLPTLLGQKLMDTFELTLKDNGYHMDYDDDMPMTTLNSVANAILPLVLSLLPPVITFYDSVSLFIIFIIHIIIRKSTISYIHFQSFLFQWVVLLCLFKAPIWP